MNDVTINKLEVLVTIRTNRDAHRAIFEEACAGYKSQALKLLEEHLARVRSGDLTRLMIALPEPVDHTGDYDRIIRMLEMHRGDTIEMGEHDFASYVMDDWDWKQQFLASNSMYSATAKMMMATRNKK